jgi:CBS domain-containing protein
MQKKRIGLLQKAFIQSQLETLQRSAATTVRETDSLANVIQTMSSQNIGCVLVTDGSAAATGIFTERDLTRKVFNKVADLSTTAVCTVMTPQPQTLKYHSSIGKALHLMSVGGFRHIPVLQRDGSWSIVSVRDFIRFIFLTLQARRNREERGKKVFIEDNEVEEFLNGRISAMETGAAVTAPEDSSVTEAVEYMNRFSTSCLILTSENSNRVKGVFSERDLLKRVMPNPSEHATKPISTVMTRDPVTFLPETSVLHALRTMTERTFRHVPLVDLDEELIGLLSIHDFVRTLAEGVVNALEAKKAAPQS